MTPESKIPPIRGTRDWLAAEAHTLRRLETQLLEYFARAGFHWIRTPILEPCELHERKSGAGIVSKLYAVESDETTRVCLRPELTAGVVRLYAALTEPERGPLPWRAAVSGPVFRREGDPGSDRLREFTQIGVELLGTSGAAADAEIIALAYSTARDAGVTQPRIRLGHAGLLLELFQQSGLPPAARGALVEILSEAAAEGGSVQSLACSFELLTAWVGADQGEKAPPAEVPAEGVDRLFRQLVPDVMGRRSGHDVLDRLKRKWELAHTLAPALDQLRAWLDDAALLAGPAADVLPRLQSRFAGLAPETTREIAALVAQLQPAGVPLAALDLDLGFSRGIGFYTQMIFEISAHTPAGHSAIGGGGRYDGLARVLGGTADDRGAGFAFGLERLAAAIEHAS
jgi:histidyl-tRNA synthetase